MNLPRERVTQVVLRWVACCVAGVNDDNSSRDKVAIVKVANICIL
jgi:hypothetical protein